MNEEIKIHELVLQTVNALEGLGLAPHTVWSYYSYAYLPIIKFHAQHNMDIFDQAIVDAYAQAIDKRFENDEISRYYYGDLKKAVERLTEFHDTGKLEWTCRMRVSKFKLNRYYEELLQEFLASESFHHNTHLA